MRAAGSDGPAAEVFAREAVAACVEWLRRQDGTYDQDHVRAQALATAPDVTGP